MPTAGATVFTFHPEATIHVQRHLAAIRERGMLAGLALNPSTPLSAIEEVIGRPRPGAGDVGQSGIRRPGVPAGRHRKDPPRCARCSSGALPRALEVDGGITAATIAAACAAGADTFVAGTAVFGAADIRAADQ